MNFLSEHEVNHILDVGNCDRTLSDICCNNHFSSTFHPVYILEGSVLFLLVERRVERYQLKISFEPKSIVILGHILNKLKDLGKTRQENQDALLLVTSLTKSIEFLDDVSNYQTRNSHGSFFYHGF